MRHTGTVQKKNQKDIQGACKDVQSRPKHPRLSGARLFARQRHARACHAGLSGGVRCRIALAIARGARAGAAAREAVARQTLLLAMPAPCLP